MHSDDLFKEFAEHNQESHLSTQAFLIERETHNCFEELDSIFLNLNELKNYFGEEENSFEDFNPSEWKTIPLKIPNSKKIKKPKFAFKRIIKKTSISMEKCDTVVKLFKIISINDLQKHRIEEENAILREFDKIKN